MKRKKPYIRLTNSEFAMMQLLWEAGRPLNRAEIMEIALRDPENPLFAKNSFHVIINNLIGYQFIAAFINDGPGRKNARRFCAFADPQRICRFADCYDGALQGFRYSGDCCRYL